MVVQDDLFGEIINDTTPLHEIGVDGLLELLLVKNGIHTVADLVQQFRLPVPFAGVDKIGNGRETFLKSLLYEHAARTKDPRAFVRFFLSRSQLLQYIVVPLVVAVALVITPHRRFDRDEWGTIAAALVAMVAFDCGRWANSPRSIRTPFTVGRLRIVAVFLAIVNARVFLSEDYGMTEVVRVFVIGGMLGVLEGLHTLAQRMADRNDRQIADADQAALAGRVAAVYGWFRKLNTEKQVTIVVAVFPIMASSAEFVGEFWLG